MTMNLFILVFTALISVGGGFNDYDYYQLDYHRPRDQQIALHLQAKAVENQGSLSIFKPLHCLSKPLFKLGLKRGFATLTSLSPG